MGWECHLPTRELEPAEKKAQAIIASSKRTSSCVGYDEKEMSSGSSKYDEVVVFPTLFLLLLSFQVRCKILFHAVML